MVMAATGSKSAAGATMASAAQSNTKTATSNPRGPTGPSNSQPRSSPAGNSGGSPGSVSRSNPSGARDGGGNGGSAAGYGGGGASSTSRIGSAASAQRMSSQQASGATSSAPNAAAAKASAAYRTSGALNAGLGRDPSPISGALNTQRDIGVGGAALGGFRSVNDVAVRNYTAGPVSPDVSYQMRFNPGTRANIDRLVGAKVVGTNPGINWGKNPNYGQIGNLYNQTISGESAFKGPKATLDQMSVANAIANRLRMASEGIGLPGNFPANATYSQVMRGFDANGIRRPDTFVDNYNTQGLNRQIGYGTTALGSLSPNAGLNQAKVNPAVARDVGSYYGMTPSNVRNVANATHYYNANVVTPSWADNLRNVGAFGSHKFGTADVTDQNVASLGQRAANAASTGSLFDTMQQSIGTFSNLLDKTDLQAPAQKTATVPSWQQSTYTGPQNVVPSWRQSAYTGPQVNTAPLGTPQNMVPSWQQSAYTGIPPNVPPSQREPLINREATPYKVFNSAVRAVGNGVFPGVGTLAMKGVDADINRINQMTPAEQAAIKARWATENRAYLSGSTNEAGRNDRPAMTMAAAAPSAPQAPSQPSDAASANWQSDALAYGYSQAQLNDPEIRALIKELWDMGFIPKTSTT